MIFLWKQYQQVELLLKIFEIQSDKYKQIVQRMKNSLYDLKKSTQKSITGYNSSYTDKYLKKATKPTFQLDRLRLTPQKNQHHYNQSHISINSLNYSFENSLKQSQNKLWKTQSKVEQNQWIGRDNQTSNDSKDYGAEHQLMGNSQLNPILINSFNLNQSLPKKSSNILIEEQIQQDLSIYQEYRILQQQYQQELEKIKQQTDKIQHQCSLERKKIAESEQLIFLKKKKLKQLEESYEKILVRNESEKKEQEAIIKMYEQKLHNIKTQHLQGKQKHSQEIQKLQNEISSTEYQNQQLQKQLSELQAQIQRYNISQSEQISTLEELESQQAALLQEITSLQKQQANLQRQMHQLQSQKDQQPISNQFHKKYLEIYQKTFITNQLHKAEEILRMKDQEKHEMEEIERRKSMIKDKKVEISLKQKRIAEKNKTIDKLTQEIRQKSTALLNLYQQQ